MIKRYNKNQEKKVFYRTNERIFALELRVLDSDGKQIGLLKKWEALEKARELGLDLVEIAPQAKPPVAKIIDYKKFLYQQAKKRQEEKRKAKVSETKEIRLGPFMNTHDLEVMERRGRGFLEDGDKIRVVVKFVGRQITHPEFGRQILDKMIAALSGISKVERDPHFEGKQLIVILSPEKGKTTHAKEENKEISVQKI